jgi:hypothetical protein
MTDPALNGIFVWHAVLWSMDFKVIAQVGELMTRVATLEKAPGANKPPGAARKCGKNGKAGADDKEDDKEDEK